MKATNPLVILRYSTVITAEDCKVIGGTLYEKVSFIYKDRYAYRKFFGVDDYDYVTDPSLLAKLNEEFTGS